jgi:hypothetical protein
MRLTPSQRHAAPNFMAWKGGDVVEHVASDAGKAVFSEGI